jgi:chromate transport protein ChrA
VDRVGPRHAGVPAALGRRDTLLAAAYVAGSGLPLIRPAAEGLPGAAVGLLLATAWRLSKRAIDPRQPLTVALALGAVALAGLAGLSAALVVLAAGLVGVVAFTSAEAAAVAAPRGAR